MLNARERLFILFFDRAAKPTYSRERTHTIYEIVLLDELLRREEVFFILQTKNEESS